jgi:hypothetical protein
MEAAVEGRPVPFALHHRPLRAASMDLHRPWQQRSRLLMPARVSVWW